MQTVLVISLAVLAIFALAVMAGAFFIVQARRSQRAWAMTNQVYTGTPTSRRFVTMPVAANIVAGQPLLIGTEPCFSLDSYQSNVGGATCLFNGSFTATVVGQTQASPQTAHQINPGDTLYATGTKDNTTNVTYNLTIDANSSNTPFGHLDPSSPVVTAGTSLTSAVVQI